MADKAGREARRAARRRVMVNVWNRLKFIGPAVIVIVAGFVFAFQFVKPGPPRKLTIASGSPSGAYYAFAQRYAERFRAEGGGVGGAPDRRVGREPETADRP
jgi:hypothetical protein